jgi:hypothetical protein
VEPRTTLDVGLVAVETGDEVAVLLDVAAPPGVPSRQVARAVSLVIRPADAVPAFTLWNDLPVSGMDDAVIVELGDFHAGERLKILLGFQLPEVCVAGAATVCELELRVRG